MGKVFYFDNGRLSTVWGNKLYSFHADRTGEPDAPTILSITCCFTGDGPINQWFRQSMEDSGTDG